MSSELCVTCGERIEPGYPDKTYQHQCFECNYWHELIDRLIYNGEELFSVREDGEHFLIHAEAERGMRGYGGAKWQVDFTDGRQVCTSNLWHQGEIPERFRKLLPDNAKLRSIGSDGKLYPESV